MNFKNLRTTLLLLCAITAGSQAYALGFPFGSEKPWVICQAYNSDYIDHVNYGGRWGNAGVYSLDFMTDLNAAKGSSNRRACATDANNILVPTGAEPILSPAAGTVSRIGSASGGVYHSICIALDNPEGEIKAILYEHINLEVNPKTNALFARGDAVLFGQKIAKIQQYDPEANHLHMTAWNRESCLISAGYTIENNTLNVPFNKQFAGYDFSSNTDSSGNPEIHEHFGVLVQAPSVPQSTLDGAASLIDPVGTSCQSKSGIGCWRDVALLHAHPTPSSAVFQVKKVNGVCDHVKVYGNHKWAPTTAGNLPNSLTSAFVTVRRWDDHYIDESSATDGSDIYKITNLTRNDVVSNSPNDLLPALIPLSDRSYSIITVTSTQTIPENEIAYISLECGAGIVAKPTTSIMVPLSKDIDVPELNPKNKFSLKDVSINSRKLFLEDRSVLSGMGSMITYSNSSFGVGKLNDIGISLSKDESTLVFQLYRSDACKSIQIDELGDAIDHATGRGYVSWKFWYEQDWHSTSPIGAFVPSSFPFTFPLRSDNGNLAAGSGDDFVLVRVKGNFGGRKLSAKCLDS